LSFQRGFLDAIVASGGETVQDAVESLQEMLAASFEQFSGLPDSKLGPRMRRERDILLEFVCRSSTKSTPKRPQKTEGKTRAHQAADSVRDRRPGLAPRL